MRESFQRSKVENQNDGKTYANEWNEQDAQINHDHNGKSVRGNEQMVKGNVFSRYFTIRYWQRNKKAEEKKFYGGISAAQDSGELRSRNVYMV